VRVLKLGDVLDVQNGFAFDSDFFSDEVGIPLIRIRDLKGGVSTDIKYKGDYNEAFKVKAGDYLIGMDGEFRCYKWKGEDGLLNQRVCRLVNFNPDIYPEYLYYGINLHLDRIERNTSFVTVKHISSRQIREIEFPFPPLEDQIRIATVLTKAEALVTQRKESIRLLDEFLKSTFLEMFGNRKTGQEYSINDLKSGGSETFSNGPFGSDLLTSELVEAGIPVVYIRDIRNGVYKWKSNVFVTEQKANSLQNCQVQAGDILIAKVGDPPGISAVYPENLGMAIITQDVVRIRLDRKIVLPKYFSFFINSNEGQHLIKKISIEGTRNRFPLGDFKRLKVQLPNMDEQLNFTHLVDKVETLKALYKQSLTEIENLFNSISQRAFKGELNLKNFEVALADPQSLADHFEKTENEPKEKVNRKRKALPKEYGDPFEGKAIPKDRLMTLTEAKKLLENKFEEIPDKERQSQPIDSAWLQARTQPVNERGRIKFNSAEGWAILDAIFFVRNFGFTSNEFIAFLQKEGIAFDSDTIANLFSVALDKKRIVQRYSKNIEVEIGRTDSLKEENIIWFAHNAVDK
jgi:type I restriction enzyme S subunit